MSDDPKTAEATAISLRAMQAARDFPDNTCPASRHVQMIAEALATTGDYPLLREDADHCAGSLASVVASLYVARSFLQSLGYTWEVEPDGTITWLADK